MTQRKSLTVHYRKMADITGALGSISLERHLRNAMTKHIDGGALSEYWQRRAWNTPTSDTLLMNIYHDDGECFFGDLTVYSSGFMQALLQNDQNTPMLPVSQQRPPQGREYIHSMMFWAVIGNHVLAIQSRSLTTKHLEQYLTWLLKDQTKEIAPEGHIILNSKFDVDDVGGSIDDVREIVVGGTGVLDAPHSSTRSVTETVTSHTDLSKRRSWGDRALEVLRAVMQSEADVMKFLETIPDEADLDVSVHIGYKSRKKRISRSPMQQALRNLPDGEVTAIGRNGRQTGKDIRLSYPVRVKCDGSLINPHDAREKLIDAYDYFVKNGKIHE